MLENLNGDLCVSRFAGKEHDLWACYEPLKTQENTKRQTWKRLTGLLSISEMHSYLERNYHCSTITDKYASISTRPQ
ncbi:hypothetical protein [Neptuniibacter pectenicola]|jgi:hypothetical protein|uniref:hypothetical protein n=1 Tax=Neptuniibacter pectenicola TaxID=1806669 RepID=UPI00079613ED|nr:hypothetical protein [Neptuniibacter pectenicola]KXJ51630.1 MAG: hypothetical protein AXW15_04410 [Neptuniibacter sp. Phe_28]